MYEIDYSKWYYSHVFFFCVKKLEKDDTRTEVVKIPKGFRFYNRVKTSYYKECGSPDLVFPSPTLVVLGSIATTIFMSSLFRLIPLSANDRSSFAIPVAANTMVITSLVIIGIIILYRNKSKEVIKTNRIT